MIGGYAARDSVFPGERLVLHVSTTAPRFAIEIYRQGVRFDAMPGGAFGWFDGVFTEPAPAPGAPFDWQPYELRIPADWPQGAYVAILVEGNRRDRPVGLPDRSSPDARTGAVLFAVRRHPGLAPAPILYKLPTFTYQAYNVPDPAFAARERERRGDGSDGQSLYTGSDIVSLHRPGGGTGGTPWDAGHAPDFYDARSPRQTFAHWDAPFIAWLERAGYGVDYCTDLDLHALPTRVLSRHRLIVSAGHDEYWSDDMRYHLERFVRGGGNVAFFAANLLWWRVRVVDESRAFRRCGHFGERVDPWTGLPYDESALTGVTFGDGGGHWIGERLATGFTVHDASHWAFAGTGVCDGEAFGARERLAGYECDGQAFSWPALTARGRIEHAAGTRVPAGFDVLAWADLRDWPNDGGATGEVLGNGSAVMGLHAGLGGTVFTAGTTDWARVLDAGQPVVDRITRNVLDRLSAPAANRVSGVASV